MRPRHGIGTKEEPFASKLKAQIIIWLPMPQNNKMSRTLLLPTTDFFRKGAIEQNNAKKKHRLIFNSFPNALSPAWTPLIPSLFSTPKRKPNIQLPDPAVRWRRRVPLFGYVHGASPLQFEGDVHVATPSKCLKRTFAHLFEKKSVIFGKCEDLDRVGLFKWFMVMGGWHRRY